MTWFEAFEDVVEAGLPDPYGTLVGLAHAGYDVGAGAYDYAVGDTEHGNDHMKDLAWDLGGAIPGPVGKVVNTAQAMKDTGDALGIGHPMNGDEPPESYDPGQSAGWGALLGMGLGGPFGLLTGAAAGALFEGATAPPIQGVHPDAATTAALAAAFPQYAEPEEDPSQMVCK